MAKQKKFNKGQKKINGALCFVDWHVIYSMKALIKALEDAGVLTSTQLNKAKEERELAPYTIDPLSKAKELLDLAHFTSKKVASIDPPGCDPNLLENGFPKESESLFPKKLDIKAA